MGTIKPEVIATQTELNFLEALSSEKENLILGPGWNPEDLHCNPVKWQVVFPSHIRFYAGLSCMLGT